MYFSLLLTIFHNIWYLIYQIWCQNVKLIFWYTPLTLFLWNKNIKIWLGSFLKINTRSKDSLGYAKDAQNQGEQVDLISLNSFCLNQKIKNIDLIKIDVQGFEAEVLLGSSKILKNVKSVMIEISLYDFYNGNSRDNFYSVHKLLNKYNFQLWDISKISKNPKNLRTDWLEAVFINSQL